MIASYGRAMALLIVSLALVGCTYSYNRTPEQATQAGQAIDGSFDDAVSVPTPRELGRKKQPKQRTAAIKPEKSEKNSNLLACEQECQAQCSSKVVQALPKWCALYEKPGN